MDRQRVTSIINRAQKVEVTTIPSVATSQQVDEQVRVVRDHLRRNAGREVIIIRVVTG